MSGTETIDIEIKRYEGRPAVWATNWGSPNRGPMGARIVAMPDGAPPEYLLFPLPNRDCPNLRALVAVQPGSIVIEAKAFRVRDIPSMTGCEIQLLQVVSISGDRARVRTLNVYRDRVWAEPLNPCFEAATDAAENKSMAGDDVVPYVQDPPYEVLFGQYDDWLMPLGEQLDYMKYYNGQHWNNFLSPDQFEALDLSAEPRQRLDEFEALHVSFGSPGMDATWWWLTMVREWRKFHRKGVKMKDLRALKYREGVPIRLYPPGIHRVKMNLVAGLRPLSGCLPTASQPDSLCAHGEVFSFAATHRELVHEMSRYDHLPLYIAGYDLANGNRLSISASPTDVMYEDRTLRIYLESDALRDPGQMHSGYGAVPMVLR